MHTISHSSHPRYVPSCKKLVVTAYYDEEKTIKTRKYWTQSTQNTSLGNLSSLAWYSWFSSV